MSSKPTILIVEDEMIVSMQLSRELARKGYAICGQAVTGEQAIALAREKSPDLIMMDIGLAGSLDGIETAKMIRAFLKSPIIFMTGYSEKEVLERALSLESTDHLSKPIREVEFQNTVQRLIPLS